MLKRLVKSAMQGLAEPARFRQALLRRSRTTSFVQKLAYDAVERPHYAYGVYHAARQAKALGLSRISVGEFGVAGGAGLKVLEAIAAEVERETGVEIHVYGFDTGKGMPASTDPRDMPFVWTAGIFRMRVKKLETELKRAKLVLGDICESVPRFLYRNYPAPFGFLSIDVDYYTSAVGTLKLLDAGTDFLLPRVFVYLDDVIGDDLETHCEFVGELAAVRHFNDTHERRKIGRINGLRHKRILPAPWNDVMYVAHIFDHPLYNAYINSEKWPAPVKGKRGKPRPAPIGAESPPAEVPPSANGDAPVVVPSRTSQPVQT